MKSYSTNDAAEKLGITGAALSKYIKTGKVPEPKIVQVGRMKLHSWTEEDIQRVRQLLPKIANGRKTRHKRQHLAVSTQQSGKAKTKTKKPQPRVATATSAAVPHKKKK